jgi:hypothetical protein
MRALLVAVAFAAPVGALAQAPQPPPPAEVKVVEYLRDHISPGERVVVSELYNQVFTSDAERAVLNRLFNTFFKLPLFLAQQQKGTGKPPTLAEISSSSRCGCRARRTCCSGSCSPTRASRTS